MSQRIGVVNSKDLLLVLELASCGIANKDMIEQGQCFRFKGDSVFAFNDEIFVRAKMPVSFDQAVSVQASTLLGILRKLSGETVTLFLSPEELIIQTASERIKFRTESSAIIPTKNDLGESSGWKKLPSEFFEALELVAQSAGTDANEPILTYVCVNPEYLAATDSLQISKYRIKTGFQDQCLLKKDTAKALAKLGLCEVATSSNWMMFFNESRELFVGCRKYQEEYLDINQHTKMKDPKELTLPKSLTVAIDRAEVFTAEDVEHNLITVVLTGGKTPSVGIMGQGSLGTYTTKAVRCEYSGPSFKFQVTPRLLKQIIEQHATCQIDTGDKLRVISDRLVVVTCLEPVESNRQAPEASD